MANINKGDTMETTEEVRKKAKIKELSQEIDKLESSRDGIIDWVTKQTEKCTELAAKAKVFNEDFVEKKNILDKRNTELVQRQQDINKQEIHLQKLKQESQFDRAYAEAAKKEVAMARQALLVKENEVKLRETSIISRESKADTAISYITSVFKTIEKLKEGVA